MLPENFAYALTQVVHNFGAVAVLGSAVFALLVPVAVPERVARLAAAGWVLQIASGAAFGGVSFYYYGRLPDLHTIAASALAVKLACAAGGLVLTLALAARGRVWAATRRRAAWWAVAALAAAALTAAAFLRWFA
ncbi:MAG: hypothetical protein OEZ08_08340 [Betaproteobacteria bacterium]|nr:hypothetical protein [Betaproteobacteria bacterium]